MFKTECNTILPFEDWSQQFLCSMMMMMMMMMIFKAIKYQEGIRGCCVDNSLIRNIS